MSIFPLTFPAGIVPNSIDFVGSSIVGSFKGAYTNRLEVVRYRQYPNQWWELHMKFPPLVSSNAAAMRGFICGLNGIAGNFFFSVPKAFLMSGTVTGITFNEGNDLNVLTGTPVVGTYGYASYTDASGTVSRLVQFTSATTIFPSFPSGTSLSISNTGGSLFRLKMSTIKWQVDATLEHDFELDVQEDI